METLQNDSGHIWSSDTTLDHQYPEYNTDVISSFQNELSMQTPKMYPLLTEFIPVPSKTLHCLAFDMEEENRRLPPQDNP